MRFWRYYLASPAFIMTLMGCAGAPRHEGSRGLVVPGSLEAAPDDARARSAADARPAAAPVDEARPSQTRVAARPAPLEPNGGDAPTPNANDLSQIMAELASLGALDAEAQQRLLADLQASDPAVWPLLMQSFRASLAIRQRRAQAGSGNVAAASDETPGPRARQDTAPVSSPLTPDVVISDAAPRRLQDDPATGAALPPEARPLPEPETARDDQIQPVAYHGTPAPPAISPATPAAIPPASSASPATGVHRSSDQALPESASVAEQLRSRLASLAAGRREDALRPISGLTAGEQEYWSQQLYALSGLLDVDRTPDAARRAAEASAHQSAATTALADLAPLRVTNLAFCTEVTSFGVCKRVQPAEFKAGQEALLYAEIENLKSESTPEGCHTSLESSYQILDAQGRRVAHEKLPMTEEHCQNRRRDYFVRYFITLPERIYPGAYYLDLTVEDSIGRKVGQSQIEFTVKK